MILHCSPQTNNKKYLNIQIWISLQFYFFKTELFIPSHQKIIINPPTQILFSLNIFSISEIWWKMEGGKLLKFFQGQLRTKPAGLWLTITLPNQSTSHRPPPKKNTKGQMKFWLHNIFKYWNFNNNYKLSSWSEFHCKLTSCWHWVQHCRPSYTFLTQFGISKTFSITQLFLLHSLSDKRGYKWII